MVTAAFVFRDNNGKEAQMRVGLRGASGITGASSFALALASALAAVSDAQLVSMTLAERFDPGAGGAPGSGSSVEREALLFYRNGDELSSFRLPSPALVLTESIGTYAGIRITRERMEVLGVLVAVEGLLTGTLDGLGRPFGTTFVVGGYSRI